MKYLILLLILSCGAGNYKWTHNMAGENIRTIPYYVDKTFDELDQKEIKSAIDQWNYSLNGNIKIEIKEFDMEPGLIEDARDNGGALIMKVGSGSSFIPDKRGERAWAWVNKIGGYEMFIVRDRFGRNELRGVILHEMGHLMGARHIEETLMHPSYNDSVYLCIDLETVKQAATYNHLDIRSMNYCHNDGY